MKPLTMTEGREELIREVVGESVARAESGGCLYAAPLLAEIDALRAALADERKHADELAAALRNPDNITVERAMDAHTTRRAKEAAE